MGHTLFTGFLTMMGWMFAGMQLGALELLLTSRVLTGLLTLPRWAGIICFLAFALVGCLQVLALATLVERYRERRGQRISLGQSGMVMWILGLLILGGTMTLKGGKPAAIVILYCAQDQTYAEPLLKQFEQETGIKVKAVYDSEAVKTVGLANRLLAERSYPRCDVFWGNEELRTRQLAAQNVFRETNSWAAFGHRSRCVVFNTKLMAAEAAPHSLVDLTNASWRGKVAMAYPQFGTTGTYMNVLRQLWGETNWLAWCRALVANQAKLVDGNSVVVKLVGRGEAAIGLTDSDDVYAGQREGLPVGMLRLEPLFIPNTVAVVRNAPHAAAAQKLFEWLQRPAVEKRLIEANALEATPPSGAGSIATDWSKLLSELDTTTKQLNEVFLK